MIGGLDSWEYSGGNGMRVGVEVIVESAITHGETSCNFTVNYHTQNQHSYGDTQTLTFGGAITGSTQITNNDSTGNDIQRATRTYTYDYGPNEYGSSPGKKTFSVSLSGAYNGVTPSASSTASITARPYGTPAIPTGTDVARNSDVKQTVTWTRHPTVGEPYDDQTMQRQNYGISDGFINVATPAGTANTYVDSGTVANRKYQYRVKANNNAGSSGWDNSGIIYTTPSDPDTCNRTTSGADQVITWANHVFYDEYQTEIWHAQDGVWDGSPLATRGTGVTTYTHTAPDPTHKHKYRVRAKTTGGVQATLYSGYSAATTETAGTTSPPSAPTNLSPTGGPVLNQAQPIQFNWTHNATDGSAQSAYQVQHRVVGSGTWTQTGKISSITPKYTLPANTYTNSQNVEWQVQTWGSDPTASAFSTSATFSTQAANVSKMPTMLNPITGQIEALSAGSMVIVLGPSASVPAGTPPGTVIMRTA